MFESPPLHRNHHRLRLSYLRAVLAASGFLLALIAACGSSRPQPCDATCLPLRWWCTSSLATQARLGRVARRMLPWSWCAAIRHGCYISFGCCVRRPAPWWALCPRRLSHRASMTRRRVRCTSAALPPKLGGTACAETSDGLLLRLPLLLLLLHRPEPLLGPVPLRDLRAHVAQWSWVARRRPSDQPPSRLWLYSLLRYFLLLRAVLLLFRWLAGASARRLVSVCIEIPADTLV